MIEQGALKSIFELGSNFSEILIFSEIKVSFGGWRWVDRIVVLHSICISYSEAIQKYHCSAVSMQFKEKFKILVKTIKLIRERGIKF